MRRAYTPERDDNVRDRRDESEDLRRKADAILDAMHTGSILSDALDYEVLARLEDDLTALSVALSREAQELNDDLGRAA